MKKRTSCVLILIVSMVTAVVVVRNLSASQTGIQALFKENKDNAELEYINRLKSEQPYQGKEGHKLALIVPYRDRFGHLQQFLPHIKKFLRNQKIEYSIYVINQTDSYRFNRGTLINIGYLETRTEFDYLVMHDVDLLPANPKLNYSYPESGPLHLSPPGLHPIFDFKAFLGGVLLIRRDHFEKVNGMSNQFWGYGKEDDNFRDRLLEAKFKISNPGDLGTGKQHTFTNLHYGHKRDRDDGTFRHELYKLKDYTTGVSDLNYKMLEKHKFVVKDAEATIIDVELKCDLDDTPWCIPIKQQKEIKS